MRSVELTKFDLTKSFLTQFFNILKVKLKLYSMSSEIGQFWNFSYKLYYNNT